MLVKRTCLAQGRIQKRFRIGLDLPPLPYARQPCQKVLDRDALPDRREAPQEATVLPFPHPLGRRYCLCADEIHPFPLGVA